MRKRTVPKSALPPGPLSQASATHLREAFHSARALLWVASQTGFGVFRMERELQLIVTEARRRGIPLTGPLPGAPREG